MILENKTLKEYAKDLDIKYSTLVRWNKEENVKSFAKFILFLRATKQDPIEWAIQYLENNE